ncbi:tetratricopeptide repeat protein, partial [Akkermansia muciniphila]|uniref:tetratricopeptide repeat protein n=1 Tax=Akkermansia muciniphila TaxID=239935 RepID=UPI001BFFAA64
MTREENHIRNTLREVSIEGNYIGGDQHTTVVISRDKPRDFIVTHRAGIKPVSYFTGREEELEILRQLINEGNKAVLVSGMGGIGKTHLCLKLCEEYITRHASNKAVPFQHIGYVEYDGDMDSSLVTCLKFEKQGQPEYNQEAAWRELEHLASQGKLLLFVDNVNRTSKEDPGLKRLGEIPGTVILTSRRASFMQTVFKPIMIGVLPLENCRHIYRSITEERTLEEESDLDYIIKQLAANHTLTVELLARTAYCHGWSPRKLRHELENCQFRLTFEDDGETVVIQEAYEKLFSLGNMSKGEVNILEAFSLFPYMPLPDNTCEAWLLSDAGDTAPPNPFFKLYEKGWLQRIKGWFRDEERYCYQMHPVFSQFIRDARKPKLGQHEGLLEGCRENLTIPDHGSPLECQQYLPLAESIAERICLNDTPSEIAFLKEIAYLLQYTGSYSKAEILCKRILDIDINKYGENHISTATSYNNLAFLYASQGRYDEALPLYQQALQILQKTLGEEHPDTATSYNNLAGLYKSQGRYDEALPLYQQALQIRQKTLGEEHPDTANSYNNLAGLYESQGRYDQALPLYQQALQTRQKTLGEEHPDTANSYNNLAGLYASQGRYGEALPLYQQALQIRQKTLGEEHPDTANSYNNLAGLYASQGRYNQALPLYQQALQILQKTLGEEHPDTATSYNNLAGLYKSQGRYDQALPLYQQALQIRQKTLGEEHPDTATSYNNLAGLYKSQGRYDQALPLYQQALQIWQKTLGEEHPDTATSYNNLAGLYKSQGRYDEALPLYQQALQIRQKTLGEEHPDTATSYNNLAGLYESQGRYNQALP